MAENVNVVREIISVRVRSSEDKAVLRNFAEKEYSYKSNFSEPLRYLSRSAFVKARLKTFLNLRSLGDFYFEIDDKGMLLGFITRDGVLFITSFLLVNPLLIRKFAQSLIKFVQENKIDKIVSVVYRHNHKSLDFQKRLGFEVVSERSNSERCFLRIDSAILLRKLNALVNAQKSSL